MARCIRSLMATWGRHRDKHVDVIARQHALDDLHAHFTADLPHNVPHRLPQFPLQHLVAILGDPDDVIAVIKNRMTAGAVGQGSSQSPSKDGGLKPKSGKSNRVIHLRLRRITTIGPMRSSPPGDPHAAGFMLLSVVSAIDELRNGVARNPVRTTRWLSFRR